MLRVQWLEVKICEIGMKAALETNGMEALNCIKSEFKTMTANVNIGHLRPLQHIIH
jgi:hypothetical protein